jgi:hypothetical protein
VLADLGGRHAERHRGVEHPRAVDVNRDALVRRDLAHCCQSFERDHRAAGVVVRRLHRDERRRKLHPRHRRLNQLAQRGNIGRAALGRIDAREKSGELGDAAELAAHDVGFRVEQHFAAVAVGVGEQRD